jgi:hypothetical protein
MNVFPPPEGIDRPHGWFTANGLTKYGPLPKREAPEEPTWPPRKLERDYQNTAVAREHLTPYPNSRIKSAE